MTKSVLKRDSLGNLIITAESTLKKYGITITQFDIKDFDFDKKTDDLIKAKKEAEQQIVAAQARAKKAKQDALTAIENGKANVAIAEANALVEKKTAVVNAEREAEVAKQNKIKAQLDADAMLATKKAEATANSLKVKAGLTPQEKAQFDKETKIGVAQALSTWKGPQVVMNGGGKGGGNGMLDALAIKQMMGIAAELNK